MQVSIIKSSLIIKQLLKERFKELGMNMSEVARDAKKHNKKTINKSVLSIYFNHANPIYGFPKEEDIIWLCLRYGIDLKLIVKKIDYDEKQVMKNLKLFFNN